MNEPDARGGSSERRGARDARSGDARPTDDRPRKPRPPARSTGSRGTGGGTGGRDTRPIPPPPRRDVRPEARGRDEDEGTTTPGVQEWVRIDDEVRDEAEHAVQRGSRAGTSPRPKNGPKNEDMGPAGGYEEGHPRRELAAAVGATRGDRLASRLKEAAKAFDHERYAEARRLLRPIVEEAPSAASARELAGLTYYRLGQWKLAVRELEAFRELTGSTEQNPVLADCYRALRRWSKVDELWVELREASPSAALVAEGRIVMAGSLADQGKLVDAIGVLQRVRRPRQPQEYHLRVSYALADLYERSGDVAQARDLFRWVARADADFADAKARARALG